MRAKGKSHAIACLVKLPGHGILPGLEQGTRCRMWSGWTTR